MNAIKPKRSNLLEVSLALTAAMLVAWLLVLAVSERVEAAFPGTNGRIAYQDYRDGNFEIYVMTPDGTGKTRLTKNSVWEGDPAVSPDGERVAFVTDRHGGSDKEELYIVDSRDIDGNGNGDNPLRLTEDTTPDYAPAFSPDGARIAYQEYEDGDSEIFVINSDGTGTPTRLTDNALFDGNPVFSPDGRKVYFVTDRDGDRNEYTELYVMDSRDIDGNGNGDNQVQLFGDPAIDYFAAAVSPNATQLAYQDYRDGDSEIYVKNLDGSGTPTRLTTNAAWDGLPGFSPDGKKLVFATDRDLGLEKEEIYTMDAADNDGNGSGDNEARLTEDTTPDYDPDWGPILPPPTFLTKWGRLGTADRQFRFPADVAVDSSGYVYVVDKDNNRIQKFGPNGTFITKWGSLGSGDGQFRYPRGLTVDSSDNIYVADTFNRRVQKFGPDGTFLTKWGSAGSGDGQFNGPSDIATDPSGKVYVADTFNNRVQKFGPDGTFLTKWGSRGRDEGQFDVPSGIATDSSGNVYVADEGNSRIQKFRPNGAFIARWGSGGSGDGQFGNPNDVATDAQGDVYVVEWNNNRVQKFGPDGTFLTKWGSAGSGDGQFDGPTGVALDPSGNVYVVDQGNSRIQKFGEKTAPTVAQVRPQNGATGVALRTNVAATFTEKMDKTTLTRANFKLYSVNAGGALTQITNVTVTPSFDGLGVVLDPYGTSATPLANNARYRAVITTGVKDLAGNPMAANKAWNFKTGT